MAKLERKQEIVYFLQLTEEEAFYIKRLIQTYHDLDQESSEQIQLREDIWDAFAVLK